jgi:hypothetical protein
VALELNKLSPAEYVALGQDAKLRPALRERLQVLGLIKGRDNKIFYTWQPPSQKALELYNAFKRYMSDLGMEELCLPELAARAAAYVKKYEGLLGVSIQAGQENERVPRIMASYLHAYVRKHENFNV